MLTSLEFRQKTSGYPGDEAVERGLLAELYCEKGRMQDYEEQRNIANGLMRTFTYSLMGRKPQAYYYLLLADYAEEHEDRSWERYLLTEGLKSASDNENLVDYVLYLGQRLDDLDSSLPKDVLEARPGRVPHPPEWEYERIAPFFTEII